MRVLFAAGGTGGHVFPALSVATELMTREPGSQVLFAGTRRGIETSLVPKSGFDLEFISIYGLRRRMALSNLLLPFVLLKSLIQSWSILKRFSPHLVFGAGGYVCGPVILAAIIKGIPTVLHEQNSRPGLTTQWLSKWVSMVLLSLPGSDVYFHRKEHLRLTGNPARFRPGPTDRRAARRHFALNEEDDTVLVFGGSLGAHSINAAVLASLEILMAHQGLQLLWQTGRSDHSMIEEKTSRHRDRVRVMPFIEDMQEAYQAADVVLCRAGATTLAEISWIGVPAILVPYPYATGGHQELNARIFQEAKAAEMIMDRDLTADTISSTILELLAHQGRRRGMTERCLAMGRPRAAADIVDAMNELLHRRGSHDA